MTLRVGLGFDVHAFGGDGPLVLGGVTIADEPGSRRALRCRRRRARGRRRAARCGRPAGSRDALPCVRRAASWRVVDRAAPRGRARGARRGLAVANVDVVVAAEQPAARAARRARWRKRSATSVGAPVSVKPKRTEGVGAVGRGEGIAAWAVALARIDRRDLALARVASIDMPASASTTPCSERTVELTQRDPGKVSIYVCGPTVYDVPHVGHGRTAIVYDTIRRYLEWRGFDVRFVSNVTDIEDKIIARAAERGTTEPELAQRVRGGVLRARWTDSVSDAPTRCHTPRSTSRRCSSSSAELVDSGHAYVVDGQGVYFDVTKYAGLRRAAASQHRAAPRVGRRTRRDRRGEAKPGRLRAVEGREAGRAGLGLTVGHGPTRLAPRVLGDVAPGARRGLRPPRRRRRPRVPPQRERARPGRGRRARVRPPLDPLGDGGGRRREDVEVARQLHDVARRARHPR